MVCQGAKLSVGLIIVNLRQFLVTFYSLTSTNIVQITWNFKRKWSLFSYISCVKTIIIQRYLEKSRSLKKNVKFFANLWHYLPINFCKLGLIDFKISQTLLFHKFYMLSQNDEKSMFFPLAALLQKDAFF